VYRVHDKVIGNHDVVVLADDDAGLTATIAPGFGGACVGLRHGEDELLHGANLFDQGAMKGRIPVLFPVVGRSFEKGELGVYRHRGRIYPMDIHGFVKDMPWREAQRRCDSQRASVTCKITAGEKTRRCYPYEFSLSLEYAVEETSLSIAAVIRNLGDEAMPFCFGYHPYFRAPIGDGRRADCLVRIPGEKIWEMSEGQPTARQIDAPPEFASGVPLPSGHLEKIFTKIKKPKGAEMSCCELLCPEAKKTIRVEFDEEALETVTVYSPPVSGFVCLEPRAGLPNALSDAAPVCDGLKEVPPGREFRTAVRIRVMPA
jgi:galactose mutarotase-like enzyme